MMSKELPSHFLSHSMAPVGRELFCSDDKWMFGIKKRCRGKTHMDDGKAKHADPLHWHILGFEG